MNKIKHVSELERFLTLSLTVRTWWAEFAKYREARDTHSMMKAVYRLSACATTLNALGEHELTPELQFLFNFASEIVHETAEENIRILTPRRGLAS